MQILITNDIMHIWKAITEAAATVSWAQSPHGECRDIVKASAYKHGLLRRYDDFSITVYHGFYKADFAIDRAAQRVYIR